MEKITFYNNDNNVFALPPIRQVALSRRRLRLNDPMRVSGWTAWTDRVRSGWRGGAAPLSGGWPEGEAGESPQRARSLRSRPRRSLRPAVPGSALAFIFVKFPLPAEGYKQNMKVRDRNVRERSLNRTGTVGTGFTYRHSEPVEK